MTQFHDKFYVMKRNDCGMGFVETLFLAETFASLHEPMEFVQDEVGKRLYDNYYAAQRAADAFGGTVVAEVH